MERKKVKSFVRLTDYSRNDIKEIFNNADELQIRNKFKNALAGKTVIMFFPESSVRTRITFEKGIHILGGQTILFPPETLDKKEDIQDVMGYLNNWADAVIVRHKNINLIEKMAEYAHVPVINAMTDVNHPCEVLADLYSLSKLRKDYLRDQYLFVGKKGNIGMAWKEAADVMGYPFKQCCPIGYEIPGANVVYDLREAVKGSDIICTDSLPGSALNDFKEYQITRDIMERANQGVILNPCPPFFRGEEVSADAIESPYFVGYEFKKYLLEIQQAVLLYCFS